LLKIKKKIKRLFKKCLIACNLEGQHEWPKKKDEARAGLQIKPAWSASKANDALFASAYSCHLT
jgi:hypothetical protein